MRSSAINNRLCVAFSFSARSISIVGGLNLIPVDVERRLTLSSTLRRVASKGLSGWGVWVFPIDNLFSPMKEKRWRCPSRDFRGAVSTGVSGIVPPELVVIDRELKLRLWNTFTKLDGKIEVRLLGFISVGCGLTGLEGKWVSTGRGKLIGTRESDNKYCSRSKERWT